MKLLYPRTSWSAKYCLLFIVGNALLTVAISHAADKQNSAYSNFTFRNGEIHSRALTERDGLAIAEGDMIFGSSAEFFGSDQNRRTRGLSNTTYGRVWPNGVVPYRLNDSLSENTKSRVREAVAHWNSFQAVTLVERTASNASAYPDFVDFVNDTRCASWIGYQGTGAQSIYTGDKCSTGTMIHEIGHALGLLHEHTRSDRDQYVQIHWDRIDPEMHINFEVIDGSLLLGEYDYSSIMHYGEYFFSNNGLPTIEPLQNTSATLGQRIETSDGDRAAVAELYKSDLSLIASSEATVTAGSTTEITLQATNNTSIGANSLEINLPVLPDTQLVSYASSAWACAQNEEGQNIKCTTPVLSPGASSTVAINILATNTSGSIQLDAQLSSRTLDTDMSDNQDSLIINILAAASATFASANKIEPDDEPAIASALDGNNVAPVAPFASAAAGGGSLDAKTLGSTLMIFATVWYRRKRSSLHKASDKLYNRTVG